MEVFQIKPLAGPYVEAGGGFYCKTEQAMAAALRNIGEPCRVTILHMPESAFAALPPSNASAYVFNGVTEN